jgi:hypothetical protein
VGRFYRDFLPEDARREMDLLTDRWPAKRKTANDSHIMPSLVQLRSLLLNEKPADLAKIATPDQFSGPASGVIASCVAVLRTSHPTRFERLIPPGEASPFVAGLERENAGPSTYLAQAVQSRLVDKKAKTSRTIWPLVTWWGWKAPPSDRRPFGSVLPAPDREPGEATPVGLNWNTEAVLYAAP